MNELNKTKAYSVQIKNDNETETEKLNNVIICSGYSHIVAVEKYC